MMVHNLTIDINYFDAEFTEAEHPRARDGRFSRSSSPSMGSRIANRGVRTLQSFGGSEHAILQQHLGKVKPEHRHKLARHISAVAKAVPNLVKSKWQTEKHHVVHAAHGIHSLASGRKPTPDQMAGLRNVGARILMTGASTAFGDPSGSLGHLAAAFGHEAVHHVIVEHALKSLVGAGMLMAPKITHKPTTDAAADLSPEDVALLQKYAEALAKAVRELDPAEIIKRVKEKGDGRA
jgi:hypothetical protein